jgi:eukaryotic-like serine/threonine-protein kinase
VARAGGEIVLGRYQLLERLGAGGFGVVWRAYDQQLRREVAIKRVEHAQRGKRAHREALASARLMHPAIAALYEARVEGDYLYLISELVRGESLQRCIAVRSLSDAAIAEIGVTVSEALEHAHARGVIHRDVKPANLIVLSAADPARERVPAKVTDFGSAQIGEEDLTRTAEVLGTLSYMAPEQSEGLEATPQTDLYALALVLFEAFSGVNPLRGRTPAATARRIGSRLPPLADYRRDLPASLTGALAVALSPRSDRRGALCALRAALERALEDGLREHPRRARGVGVPLRRVLKPRDRAPQTRERARGPAGWAPARVYWWAAALAAIGWQAFAGHAGAALLLCAAALPLLALPRGAGPGWLLAAAAPLLGMVGLAAAFPALAGQATRLKARAGLGALGYWWLLLAAPLIGRRLWVWPSAAPQRAAPASAWTDSLAGAASHIMQPLLSASTLAGIALWAAAAAVLPWIVRGNRVRPDALAAAAWASALLSGELLLDSGLDLHAGHPPPRGALLGAIACAALAVCARALRGPNSVHDAA